MSGIRERKVELQVGALDLGWPLKCAVCRGVG